MYFQVIHTIGITHGLIPNINHNKLKNIILKNRHKKIDLNEEQTIDWDMHRYEDSYLPMNSEFEKIIKYLNDQFKYLNKRSLKLLNYWAHIHEKNMSTLPHNHLEDNGAYDENLLSGVYYVQVPKNSGKLVFNYPHTAYHPRKYFINPEEGMFCLFSYALDHLVTRNLSEETRISVSFNLKSEPN